MHNANRKHIRNTIKESDELNAWRAKNGERREKEQSAQLWQLENNIGTHVLDMRIYKL